MIRQEKRFLGELDGSMSYWQYRYNSAKQQPSQPQEQANPGTDDTWIIVLGVLGALGSLALLAATVIYSML